MFNDDKFVNFEKLITELKFIRDDEGLPQRDDPKYIGDETIKGIEQIGIHEFNPCIMYEMAIRNKDVIEIKSKIDYILELMIDSLTELKKKSNHPIHEDLLYLEVINFKNLIKDNIPWELEDEYIKISSYPLDRFKKELDFLEDNEYSNDNIKSFFNRINTQLSTTTTKYYYELNLIMEVLQNKLKYDFFIYPKKYYKGIETICKDKVISRDMIPNYDLDIHITKEIDKILTDFRQLKPDDVKSIADLFFMYDYKKIREEQNDTKLMLQDIRFALTKYTGVEIKGIKNKEGKNIILSFEECLKNQEKYKKEKGGFSISRRRIEDKIKMMENFIDKAQYRFLIFN